MNANGFTFLQFERSEGDDGVLILEAVASTTAPRHSAARAEVDGLLSWLARHYPQGEAPIEEGGDWLAQFDTTDEADGWRLLSLTLSLSTGCAQALEQAFGPLGAQTD